MDKVKEKNDYSVVILAAGTGSRLKKTGFTDPKCLLKIHGKTLLENILENLKSRGFQNIDMIVGYKYSRIIDFVKSNIKFSGINFITIKNYSTNGHAYTLYKYKKRWLEQKRNLIMLHADLYYDWKYFDEIMKNPNNDMIGMTTYKFSSAGPSTLAVNINKDYMIKTIRHKRLLKNPNGQILCINKISSKTTKKLFSFMNSYFKNKDYNKKSWETLFNDFINSTNAAFYTNDSKKYPWFNINSLNDLKSAEKYHLS